MLLLLAALSVSSADPGASTVPDDLPVDVVPLVSDENGTVLVPEPKPERFSALEASLSALRQGDAELARRGLERWLSLNGAREDDRDVQTAWYALGLIYLEEGRLEAAHPAFTFVRVTNGPLAPFAAWEEARIDLERGAGQLAARECAAYRERWPQGLQVDDCLLLEGMAWTEHGQRDPAIASYTSWLGRNAHSPREEEIRFRMAEAEALVDPDLAATLFQQLTVQYQAQVIANSALERLDALEAAGATPAPLDEREAAKFKAQSLRDNGLYDEAWALYKEIETRWGDEPVTKAWLSQSWERFARKTLNYKELAAGYERSYSADPSAGRAWAAFRSHFRDGNFKKAAAWGQLGLKKYGTHSKWRHQHDQVAHALQLAGEYEAAIVLWDHVAENAGGSVKTAGKWFGGFASYRAGDHEQAISRLSELTGHKDYSAGALYYRGKAYNALGREDQAAADWNRVRSQHNGSWYDLMLESRWRSGTPDGEWHEGANTGQGPLLDSYAPSVAHDPQRNRQTLEAFAERHAVIWPELDSAVELARVGAHTQAAELLQAVYAEYWSARKGSRSGRKNAIRKVSVDKSDWRRMFQYVQHHHYVAKLGWGNWRYVDGAEAQLATRQLAWPTAHREHVERWSAEFDVDPYLVLGLMRQESLYRSTALSRAGAVGVMQIMPATGSKVARLLDDPFYTPAMLEDPAINVRYGTFYLGALIDRFDGAWPLAVASYNAGPVNVSSWYRSWNGDIEMDDFVEQIPLRETRGYVKRVSANYSTYVELYEGPAPFVHVPRRPAQDDPTVINF